MYHIVKYKDTRYWAVLHHNGKLLAVVVYKKGAEAIVQTASGCGAFIKEYGHLLSTDPAYADKAKRVSALAKEGPVASPQDHAFTVKVAAFVLSELKTAFMIGCVLFIPFLVIDLVVSSVLMAMGMMMLSPLVISLPFKILLFVLVDGWSLTVNTLVTSVQGL